MKKNEIKVVNSDAQELKAYYERINHVAHLFKKNGFTSSYIKRLRKVENFDSNLSREFNRVIFNTVKKCDDAEFNKLNTIYRHIDQDLEVFTSNYEQQKVLKKAN